MLKYRRFLTKPPQEVKILRWAALFPRQVLKYLRGQRLSEPVETTS